MIYACSDLHGQFKLFLKMLDEINFSSNDTLYILGDTIDRGPEGIKILQFIMQYDNIILLLGNHELMLVDHEANNYERDFWRIPENGGMITQQQLYELSQKEYLDIIEYVRNSFLQVELSINNKTYLLSHSSFLRHFGTLKCSDCPNSYFNIFNVVWDSPWRSSEYICKECYSLDNRIHIIGHVPVQRIRSINEEPITLTPYIEGPIINIDGGCAMINESTSSYWKNLGIICLNLTDLSFEKPDFYKGFNMEGV